jgi:gamma-glutamylcyclotransferase (GGCT)/AIG2-like uncharacterized protein YtfP
MHLLFSYGTLQQPEVQQANYRRLLNGSADVLPGYRLDPVTIADPEVVRLSGKAVHPIARFTGDPSDHVTGACFELTDEELAATDAYEDPAYRRVEVSLASGLRAFAYVGQAIAQGSDALTGASE